MNANEAKGYLGRVFGRALGHGIAGAVATIARAALDEIIEEHEARRRSEAERARELAEAERARELAEAQRAKAPPATPAEPATPAVTG